MNLYDAINEINKNFGKSRYIRRQAWQEDKYLELFEPEEAEDYFISHNALISSCVWVPIHKDLIADDWECYSFSTLDMKVFICPNCDKPFVFSDINRH